MDTRTWRRRCTFSWNIPLCPFVVILQGRKAAHVYGTKQVAHERHEEEQSWTWSAQIEAEIQRLLCETYQRPKPRRPRQGPLPPRLPWPRTERRCASQAPPPGPSSAAAATSAAPASQAARASRPPRPRLPAAARRRPSRPARRKSRGREAANPPGAAAPAPTTIPRPARAPYPPPSAGSRWTGRGARRSRGPGARRRRCGRATSRSGPGRRGGR
jgi:hypothetical protein